MKRCSPGEKLVDHHRKSILVGCKHRVTSPLLRSHVGRCASNSCTRIGSGRVESGYAKISQEKIWIVRILFSDSQQEIGGFDVLVNDLVVVRMLEGNGGMRQ